MKSEAQGLLIHSFNKHFSFFHSKSICWCSFPPRTYTFHCHHLPNLRGSLALPPLIVFTFREVFTSDSLLSKLLKKSPESTWGGVGLGVGVGEGLRSFAQADGNGVPKRGSACESSPFLATTIQAHSWEAHMPGNLTKFFKPPDPSPT